MIQGLHAFLSVVCQSGVTPPDMLKEGLGQVSAQNYSNEDLLQTMQNVTTIQGHTK